MVPRQVSRIFTRLSRLEREQLADVLRTETVGGVLLLIGAAAALVWANSPWGDVYETVRDAVAGPASWHLELTVSQWASDGLLAVFFFVAGLELKHELVAGDLRDPSKAVLPVVAALAGVAVPAGLYLALTWGDSSAARGWAVPTATDIAFALAVLAVVGAHLPSPLRSFLLTLAVVDDLVAIVIIALFYTDHLELVPLLSAVALVLLFGAAVRHPAMRSLMAAGHVGGRVLAGALVAVALTTWALVHASGVHATVSGVLLALTVPARSDHGSHSAAEQLAHRLRPFSAGVAVPLFALMAAGVSLTWPALVDTARDRAAIAVVVALVVGKTIGVFGGTWLTARFTRAQLDDELAWSDVLGVSLLAGVGFTVSLLIGELAFGSDSGRYAHVKSAVLAGSLLASVMATVVLRRRNAVYRRIQAAEETAPL